MEPSIIHQFMSLYEGTEVPPVYALWNGLFSISAALGRNVCLRFNYDVYPNLYVVYVAGSGLCRKSTAIKGVSSVLHQVKPKISLLAQQATPEAIVEALAPTPVPPLPGRVSLEVVSSGVIIADELTTFLNRGSVERGMVNLLNALYDSPDFHTYHTRGRGKEELRNVCVCLLGGSTIPLIREEFPKQATGAGLTSRINFVYVPAAMPRVAFVPDVERRHGIRDRIVERLSWIRTNVQGEITVDQVALQLFKKYYEGIMCDFTRPENAPLQDIPGYPDRRHMHWLTLAILCRMAREPSLVISEQDLNEGLQILHTTEQFLPMLVRGIASSESGDFLEAIYKTITARADGVNRQQLVFLFQNRLKPSEMDELIKSLQMAGRIQEISRGPGNIHYVKRERG